MGKLSFKFEDMKCIPAEGDRVLAGEHLVIHCHHYNSRLQRSLENCSLVDGKAIFKEAAERTFFRQIRVAASERRVSNPDEILKLAADLFRFQGFGVIDFSSHKVNQVRGLSSHYVEGWNCCYQSEHRKVCSFSEGYIAAAMGVATGKRYEVNETQCMYEGAECCQFEITETENHPLKFEWQVPETLRSDSAKMSPAAENSRVDMVHIRDTVFGLPLEGNELGLIPAFNVYLAHMPREFYNVVSGLFIKEMEGQDLGDVAFAMLEEDAEVCSLTTFSGIMASDEWAGLVQPMIKHTEDNIYGLIAVINALGWGIIRLNEHTAAETMMVQSANAYEMYTPAELRAASADTHCPMMAGVMSGVMELVYLDIPYEDRRGIYLTKETECSGLGAQFCEFKTKRAVAEMKVAA